MALDIIISTLEKELIKCLTSFSLNDLSKTQEVILIISSLL